MRGLIQRARLLDRLLADIYGPAETIFGGLLPPELIWANPGFLRPCHGLRLPQNRWLHLYAADLVRAETGQYEVLSDRTQAPSGAGYSLENRIVLSRALPSVFRQCNVQRLAPFFVSLRETLTELAPANHENPRIVLLTPGPYNETYFEHSFLARYLGYTLVQGNDLTVRDTMVYMKTLGGLQRVDVILRRVDDNFCDPLELYPDSYLGVPGLLQAVRRGNVALANAIGCGVLQAPGFLPFLPGLCRHFLGEELKLPSVRNVCVVLPARRIGVCPRTFAGIGNQVGFPNARVGSHIRSESHQRRSRSSQREDQGATRPLRRTETIYRPCTTPALIGEDLKPRRFVVRSYLSASYGDSYTVMNGGLTRITQSNDSLVVSLQRGGRSKDTWILSDTPVVPVTLLPSTGQPIPLSRGGSDLPSRLAEDLFWLGRYAERTDSQARLARAPCPVWSIRQALRALMPCRLWRPPVDRNLHGGQPGAELEHAHSLTQCSRRLKKDEDLRGTIANVHRLARVLRDTISTDAWRILREIYTVRFREFK